MKSVKGGKHLRNLHVLHGETSIDGCAFFPAIQTHNRNDQTERKPKQNMKTMSKTTVTAALAFGLSLAMTDGLRADSFGSGVNAFTIDFVTVGNPGNSDDAGAGGGSYSSPYGGVSYTYRMGVYEISQDAITKATNLGMTNVTAGAWGASQPAANMQWYEAAAFVNWLNTSKGYQAAYNLTYSGGWSMSLWSSGQAWQAGGENLYRHKDAFYFLPSEDEWYKAAYHQNNGVTADYWDYATGSNTAPTAVASGTGAGTAVYNGVTSSPAAVGNAGGLSPYGTMGQNGNVWEWNESLLLNGTARGRRGGSFHNSHSHLASTYRNYGYQCLEEYDTGFRVAQAVPEPSSVVTLLGGLAGLIRLKRRKA